MSSNSKLPPFLNQASPLTAITEGLANLAQRSSDAFKQAQASGPTGAMADVGRNFRAAVGAQASKLDLVTQEEFQVQRALLEKSMVKLAELTQKITDLETRMAQINGLKTPENGASSGTSTSSTTPQN